MSRVTRVVIVAALCISGLGITAAPAQACMGELCDAVNRVCDIADLKKDYHWQCVG